MPLYFNGPRASGKTHWCFENAKMVNGVVYLGYGTPSTKSYFAEVYKFPEEHIKIVTVFSIRITINENKCFITRAHIKYIIV